MHSDAFSSSDNDFAMQEKTTISLQQTIGLVLKVKCRVECRLIITYILYKVNTCHWFEIKDVGYTSQLSIKIN